MKDEPIKTIQIGELPGALFMTCDDKHMKLSLYEDRIEVEKDYLLWLRKKIILKESILDIELGEVKSVLQRINLMHFHKYRYIKISYLEKDKKRSLRLANFIYISGWGHQWYPEFNNKKTERSFNLLNKYWKD